MLAPNLLDVQGDLATARGILLNVSGFVQPCLSASVAQLSPPLDWIDAENAVLTACRVQAERWLAVSPSLVPEISQPFREYFETISIISEDLSASDAASDWSQAMKALQQKAQSASDQARDAQDVFAGFQTAFAECYEKLQQAISTAQQELAHEEADILKVAVALQALTDQLDAIGGGSSLGGLSDDTTVYQTAVDITYTMLAEGEEGVPFLSALTYVFSVGSSVYSTLTDDATIESLTRQVAALMTALSADARALAMTHALLANLAALNAAYTQAKDRLPRLNSYWDAEVAKIGIVIEALRHSEPTTLTEITGLPTAVTIWKEIAAAAARLSPAIAVEPRTVVLKIAA